MRSKSIKMMFVASMIRHKLCMIYAFFDYFVQISFSTKKYFGTAPCFTLPRYPALKMTGPLWFLYYFFSKITFYWKSFSDCCDRFDYPGSIVYLYCFLMKFLSNLSNLRSLGIEEWSRFSVSVIIKNNIVIDNIL